jgi:D-alanine--poly(phosphoribitol) ligase subunit 1
MLAAKQPDATALVARGERISYGTLNAAADSCAAELARRGVGPGAMVPVMLPRSPMLVVSLLGILKAGAAYAAFDRRWPAGRTDVLLRMLDSPVTVGPLGGTTGVFDPAVRTLREWAALDERSPESLNDAVAPATVFFTSGTTGVPKGVVSPHQATTRLFASDGPLAFGPGQVMTQAASPAWDAFSLELWGMLTTGGTAVLTDHDFLVPGVLRRLIVTEGVTTAWLTASLFNLFIDTSPDVFMGLRSLFIGGERLSVRHVGEFLSRYPDVQLVNGYGPVETCVFATCHLVRAADLGRPGGIPLGRPVPDTRIHLAGGEIWVSGGGLALGYLGQPRLTAEKFGEELIDGTPTRVYRTGDLGFLDAEGVLHFEGRADRQVKIRGYRIEPGEIEAAAGSLPGVAQCVAAPVPGPEPGTYREMALFYRSADRAPDQATDPATIRRLLAGRLPGYALPGLLREVTGIPLTPNGKTDTAALLAQLTDDDRPTLEVTFHADGGESQMTWGQRQIWQNMTWLGEGSHFFNSHALIPVPAGVNTAHVAAAIRGLVKRHAGLRTVFPGWHECPVQRIRDRGTIQIAVHDEPANQAGREAERLARTMAATRFRHETEWPARFALVTADGVPHTVVVVASHLVVDGGCWGVLTEELGQLLAGAAPSPSTAWSPAQVALDESGPNGQAVHDAAVRYWRTELLRVPPSIFDLPAAPPEPDRIWGFTMTSAAVAQAARRIAAAERCSCSAVIMAVMAAVLGHYTGHDVIPMQVVVRNRWRKCVTRTVVPLCQNGLLTVPLHSSTTFGELASLTWRRAMICYQHASYHPGLLDAEMEAVRVTRGAALDKGALFNDVRSADNWPSLPPITDPERELAGLRDSTRIDLTHTWSELDLKLFLYLLEADEHAKLWLQVDTRFVPGAVARQLLADLEAVLVRAACHPLKLTDVGAISAITPARRGGNWVRVAGGGWTDLAAVRDLVRKVPGMARSGVFLESAGADGAPGRLVAYAAPSDPGISAERIHAQVCAALGKRTDVMAPQHYLLCADAPAGNSHKEWSAQTIINAASGRP